MIREIRGTILSRDTGSAVIDVGGWGVLVHLASSDNLTEGTTVSLKTYLAVKQDGMDLYGFPSEDERRFFEMLVGVSGVGPKTALSILRKAPHDALQGAIAKRDIDYLTRVIGLSKKAAEKLAIELSEKMGGANAPHDAEDAEVFDTLVALGYTDREARKALSALPASVLGKDARLKAALAQGGR